MADGVTNKIAADDTFKSYLHQEYSYIAEAHFRTIETISTFFKHYIALMTIPIILIAYLFSKAENLEFLKSTPSLKLYGGILLFVISLAGAAVMLYIINLRLDAVLYARTINGIRKYFYDRAEIDLNTKLRMRTLPQTTFIPAYFERRYFLPVISTFAVLDSFYWSFGYITILEYTDALFLTYAMISLLSFLSLHFTMYVWYSDYREFGYLKSNIIGIDIDGVLNKHRDHFCKLVKEKFKKDVLPEQITHIPVHELGLTSVEEDNEVFNDSRYWIDMPLEDDSPKNMRKLRNIFKLKVLIFTYRGWPNTTLLSKHDKKKIFNEWRSSLTAYDDEIYKTLPKKFRCWIDYRLHKVLSPFLQDRIINRITQLWLRKHRIEYDDLILERGNTDTTDPRSIFRNRYQYSRKKKIKYFVEDDLEKAIKLAFICDVVYLIDHPYNKFDNFPDMTIPTNIIRVNSWNDIYRNIRKIS